MSVSPIEVNGECASTNVDHPEYLPTRDKVLTATHPHSLFYPQHICSIWLVSTKSTESVWSARKSIALVQPGHLSTRVTLAAIAQLAPSRTHSSTSSTSMTSSLPAQKSSPQPSPPPLSPFLGSTSSGSATYHDGQPH